MFYRYGIAAIAAALALFLTWATPLPGRGFTPLLLAAIMLSAWYGGLGPGLCATALSALALSMLLSRTYSAESRLADEVRLGVFVLVAILISTLNAAHWRLEDALRRQARFKDVFVATLAHELRTPLATLLNAIHALRLIGLVNDSMVRTVELAERQGRNMSRLVQDLLDLSSLSNGKLRLDCQPADLVTIVVRAIETARPLIDAGRHSLEVSLPQGTVPLKADPQRLEQVVVNLLANAARYTEPGGRIWVEVEHRREQTTLRVRDTGIGIAPDTLTHVFDLFAQAGDGSRGGLGIGLSLVQRLVHLHGGTVLASSPGPGKGSEFVVRLPTAPGVVHPSRLLQTNMVEANLPTNAKIGE